MSLIFTFWPIRRWLDWRVENTVMDWALRAGPFTILYTHREP